MITVLTVGNILGQVQSKLSTHSISSNHNIKIHYNKTMIKDLFGNGSQLPNSLAAKREELCRETSSLKTTGDIANLLMDRIATDNAFIDDEYYMYEEESELLTLAMHYIEATTADRSAFEKELLARVKDYIANYSTD